MTLLKFTAKNALKCIIANFNNFYNSSPTSSYKTDETKDGKYFCKHCTHKSECKLIYDVEFITQENLGTEGIIKLHLFTFDDEGVIIY